MSKENRISLGIRHLFHYRTTYIFLIVFLASFLVRLAYLLDYRESPFFHSPIVDAQFHDNWAKDIVDGDIFSLKQGEVLYKAPLYPYFMASVYWIFGHNFLALRTIQILVGSLSCSLLFLIALHYTKHRYALIGALLYCLYCDLQCQTDTKGICLQVEVPKEVIHVLGDGKRLMQVLTNLGTNAVKFTPVTGEITLSATRDGARVTIEVADTGIGMSAEDREKLFTKFFRSKESKRREIPGTGLGLCIAKRIVEAHGGEIQIESEEGKGTTARVTLPALPKSG